MPTFTGSGNRYGDQDISKAGLKDPKAPANAGPLVNLPLPGPDWVWVRTEALFGDRSGGLLARLAEPSPQVIAGGGFEDVARPLRRGSPTWRGSAAPTLPLSLIIGGPRLGPSVEPQCLALTHLAGGMMAGDPEPPEVLVRGAMIPPEAKGSQRWVIGDQPAWDTSNAGVTRHATHGYRQRQAVDIVLMLVAKDDELSTVVAPAQAAPRYRHVKARVGDTFEKIAKRELGSAKFAHKLAALNGRGGGSVSVKLAKGLDVKVPTGSLLAEWKRELKKAKG